MDITFEINFIWDCPDFNRKPFPQLHITIVRNLIHPLISCCLNFEFSSIMILKCHKRSYTFHICRMTETCDIGISYNRHATSGPRVKGPIHVGGP